MGMIWRAETSHPQKEKHILAGGRGHIVLFQRQKDSNKGLASSGARYPSGQQELPTAQWSQVWFLVGWKRRVGTCEVLVCTEPEPWLAPAPQHQLPTGHSLCLATSSLLGTGCHFLPAQLFKHENNIVLIFWTVYYSIYISIAFNVIIILVFSFHSLPFSCFLHPTSSDSQQFLKCPAAILWYIILIHFLIIFIYSVWYM